MFRSHESRARLRVPCPGWALAAGPLFCALAALLPGQAFAAAPAAGTAITSTATARYDDASGPQVTTSNTVRTTVQQVYAHTLTNSQTLRAPAGGDVVFRHTLTNTGNGPETFDLTAALGSIAGTLTDIRILADQGCNGADNNTPIFDSGSVAQNADFCFVVAAQIPPTAAQGTEPFVHVGVADRHGSAINYTATSTPPGSGVTGNIDKVTIADDVAFNVTQTMTPSVGAASNRITVRIDYTNSGSQDGPLTLRTFLGAARRALPDVSTTTFDSERLCFVPGTVVASRSPIVTFNALTAPAGSACVAGEVGELVVDFSNITTGSAGFVSFQVDVKNTDVAGTHSSLATQFAYGPAPAIIGATAVSSYRAIAAGGVVAVDITDVAYLSDTSGGDDAATATTAIQGQVVTYKLKVTNAGQSSDTFDLVPSAVHTFPSGTTFAWQTASESALNDTAGTSAIDTGVLAAGAEMEVLLRVTLPGRVLKSAVSNLVVTAQSVADNTKSDTVNVSLGSITGRAVDIYPTSIVPDGAFEGAVHASIPASANPGTTARILFTVNNSGSNPTNDQYEIEVFGDYTHNAGAADLTAILPAAWAVGIRGLGGTGCPAAGTTVTSFTLAPGAVCNFEALVAVPAGHAPGAREVDIRVRSTNFWVDGAESGAMDAMWANVNVARLQQVVLQSAGNRTSGNGVRVHFSHELCNQGNVQAIGVTVSASNSEAAHAFTNTFSNDVGSVPGTLDSTDTGYVSAPLPAGECKPLLHSVNVPSVAPAGTTNISTLTTTASWGGGDPDTVEITTDTVRIVLGALRVRTSHALITIALPPSAFPAGALTENNLSAVPPGAVIAYQVRVENTGSDPVTGVTIEEAAPATTALYSGGQCLAGLTLNGGVLPSAVTTSGAAIQGLVGTMQPGDAAVLRFCVRVDS